MKEYLELYLRYKTMNRKVSQMLGIRHRDRKIERYLLINIVAFSRSKNEKEKNVGKRENKIKKLKENSESFIEYYRKRGISVGFRGLDLIACRILVLYFLEGYDEIDSEISRIGNAFAQEYLRRKLGGAINEDQQYRAVL